MKVLLALACVLPMAANAVQCLPHDDMVAAMARGYGEGRVSVALDSAGRMVEVLANLDTGTWTAVITTPGGDACIAASGTDYEAVETPAGVEG